MSRIYEIELEDGRVLEIEAESPSVEPEKKSVRTPFAGEQAISRRPSILQEAAVNPITPQDYIQHPFKTTGKSIGRKIGGAMEIAEGIPADVALALQRRRPDQIPSDIMNTLSGQRPAQRGDIMRELELENRGLPSEAIASTVGLVSGGAKLAPETIVTDTIVKGIGSAALKTQLPQLIGKYGKDSVAKAISVFGQVPEDQVAKAIQNPNILSNKFVRESIKKSQEAYKKVVQPLIDDSSKKVKTDSLKNLPEELGLINKSGEWTKTASSMKPSEMNKILKWENRLQKGEMSFNQADALIGEIDSSLKNVYKLTGTKGEKISMQMNSDDFIRTAKTMRKKLSDVVKSQYKEAGKVMDDYKTAKTAETVYKNFDRWLPHLMPAIVANAAATPLGIKNPALFGVATLAAVPKLQGYGIRAADIAKRNIGKSGAMATEAIFDEWRRRRI